MMRFTHTFLLLCLLTFISVTHQSTFCMSIFNFSPKNLFSTNILPGKEQIKNAAFLLATTTLPAMVDGCYHCSSTRKPDDAPMDPAGIAITTIGSILICAVGCTAAWVRYCIDVSHLPLEEQREHKICWLRVAHIFGCYKNIKIPEDNTTSIPLEKVIIPEKNPLLTE